MRNLDLLSEVELPDGFVYPRQFVRVISLGLTNLEPWYVVVGSELQELMDGLNRRYPERNLIPFARRQDNDDVACWQIESNDQVYIVHDFASPGWENRMSFPNFYEWFRRAVEDLIEFDI